MYNLELDLRLMIHLIIVDLFEIKMFFFFFFNK